MAEAENASPSQDTAQPADGAETPPIEAVTIEEAAAAKGPGIFSRAWDGFRRWHPVLFLGIALAMAVAAWLVYPKHEARQVPPATLFYADGLDRLYRVLNPDLPLIAATPFDEALAARSAFLNLFVFHRAELRKYPRFVNPHLLLAESNRLLAEFNPALADKYYADAAAAYADAAIWENREDSAANLAVYFYNNYMEGKGAAGEDAESVANYLAEHEEEVVLRRARRQEYVRYRQAEADVQTSHPELARPALEDIQRTYDALRREELRRLIGEDSGGGAAPRRAFELGPDEYRNLDLLLARAYDGLGMLDRAKAWYLRYLSAVPGGRNHAFVVERLAAITLGDGEVYRKANPERAAAAFEESIGYYNDLMASPAVTREQRDGAVLGLATANSRLAALMPAGAPTGIDELNAAGRTLKGWLEEFSGQPLPSRTLGLPAAMGGALAKPELLLPGPFTLPGAAGGGLLAMAGGGVETPHERRRRFLVQALENYDRLATLNKGTEAGDRAAVLAARESWNLGRKADTEARLERLIDPLSGEELILASRLGLAEIALDRGDLLRAHLLVLGGYAHTQPLWFVENDADWRKFAARLGNPANRSGAGAWSRVWEMLPGEGRDIAGYAASGRRLDDEYVGRFLRSLNTMLRRADLYRPDAFPAGARNFYLNYLLNRPADLLTPEDVVWRNRLLLEEAWPYDISQRAAKSNIGFQPLPPGRELPSGGLVDPDRVRAFLIRLAAAWADGAVAAPTREERLRMVLESVDAYQAALGRYNADPGETLYELARDYEALAEIRDAQGDHAAALSYTAMAARSYLDVSLKARGSPREMEALLAAGDAFFRAGLLERTVESQRLFLERFGYSSAPGGEGALAMVRAENLLGRAYWFLNDTANALDAFRRNIPRRTPDRYKSIYYIGRVLMEEGAAKNDPKLLGSDDAPLPELDRNNDPVIATALQAFNYLRQSPGINPTARAWRWSTFDLARLRYIFAERARRDAAAKAAQPAPAGEAANPWLPLYDVARMNLTEALERYPLRRNGGIGLSVRVEPEDYADVMSARFETEYYLANTLLVLAGGRQDDSLSALARAHLENLRDRGRYANALFDVALDRFQLNPAVIREEVEGGNRDPSLPLPRSRLGDDEGPTRSPQRLRSMLRNSMFLLADAYFQAGEAAYNRQLLASADPAGRPAAASGDAAGFYRQAHEVYQDIYDRFGMPDGSQAMVGMGDALARLGYRDDAANHYRLAKNIADMQPADTRSDGRLDIGPAFWGRMAEERLRDMAGGYTVP